MSDWQRQFTDLIRHSAYVMGVLAAVQECGPPDWYVGAGLLRSLVWDHLHGYERPTPVHDVDVIFFDPADADDREASCLTARLRDLRPDVPWEVTNQANVHRWHPDQPIPLTSSLDGMGRWPETATAVGAHLTADGALLVAAPCGLEDLFNLTVRCNPRHTNPATFRQRVAAKQFTERWPNVRIIAD